MKKHATTIPGFSTFKDAAGAIGKMRYDALAEFLECLTEEMVEQQTRDCGVGKIKLARDTELLIQSLNDSHKAATLLFERYKKFMKEELEDTK